VAQDSSNPLGHLLSRLGLPTEQIGALQQQFTKALLPAEQLRMMRDLMGTFAPSSDQIEGVRRQLDGQRTQLESMMAQLDQMESTLERLAATAEQVRSMQEPFLRLTRTLFGTDGTDDEEEE
jgi:methyl-accepting chemotaxis protein